MSSPQNWQKKAQQLERALNLINDIDHIRDHEDEPLKMLTAIVNLLADTFKGDLCLLALKDRETAEIELKVIERRHQSGTAQWLNLLVDRTLVTQAMTLNGVTVWRTDDRILQALELPHDLQVAAVPIMLDTNERLGAILLARRGRPFSESEIELLDLAEDHVDSAVIQGYHYDDLAHHNKELELIYRIDRLRDEHLPLGKMLNEVLQVVQEAIPSEMGFAMLYDRQGGHLGMQAATHDDLFRVSDHTRRIEQVANQSLTKMDLLRRNDLQEGRLNSIMCLPLILNDRVIGVLGVINRFGPRGFTAHDQSLLSAIGSQMDTAIFETMERRHLRQVLGRAVDQRVMERILASGEDVLKTERMEISVLYADIRGSTKLAEETEPDLLVAFINDYLSHMTDVVLEHQGTLDKFVGDEVMALFGAPFPQADHALHAVQTGLAMQVAHQAVMDKWTLEGVNASPIGVGIATGDLIVGEMGSRQRTDYTVIGKAANLGARICNAAAGGQVLISPQTYALVKDRVEAEPVPGRRFKGVAGDVTVYLVKSVVS